MKGLEMKEKVLTQGMLNPQEPHLLTVKKAARSIGLSVWAMRTRIWNGEIPVVRFEGEKKQYVDSRDLETLIAKNKHLSE
jgi:hypothetical protein